MERGVLFYLAVVIAAMMAAGCEKDTAVGIPVEETNPAEKDPEPFTPVERLFFRMDGEICNGGEGDSLKLQEEGLRTFGIAGYEPAGATLPIIDSVNFYRDIYSFSYSGDSIGILGGSYALPKNHYISAEGRGFADLKGKALSDSTDVKFYNYVNRSYDYTQIQQDRQPLRIRWRDIGRLRKYRVEVVLRQPSPNSFTFHFYELENRIVLPDTIWIRPGEKVELNPTIEAPNEFKILHWSKGHAAESYNPLNGSAVTEAFNATIGNDNLTEKGKRYTNSKIHLTNDGVLSVDADWSPSRAMSLGGAVYDIIPICVIAMPQGEPQVEKMKRAFTFPGGNRIEQYPTPFYCNSVVRIVHGN